MGDESHRIEETDGDEALLPDFVDEEGEREIEEGIEAPKNRVLPFDGSFFAKEEIIPKEENRKEDFAEEHHLEIASGEETVGGRGKRIA